MKLRSLLQSALAAFAVLLPSIRAASTSPAPPAAEEKTVLEKTMEGMGKASKALKKQIGDPAQNAASLDLVAAIRSGAEKALELTPAKASDLPEADRAKFVADYRDSMREFIAAVDKLAGALKAGDNTAASRLLKELGSLQHKDHKQYRRPEKD